MSDINVDLTTLLPADLATGKDLVKEGRAKASEVERSRSLFCETNGVNSEREWRERAKAGGFFCNCMNIGLATWADTREALGCVYEDALSRGVRPPDRFNLLAERRMGLPKDRRKDAPQETGPALWTDEDWWELTHSVPIQPEVSDNAVGGPGSFENAVDALRVGVTYIGNLAQYVWRWPYWDDDVAQTEAVVKAAGLCSVYSAEGVCLDSYIDDGYPGMFHDYANYVAWAMLERYITEELIGAAYSCSWGGLTQNPTVKTAVTLALEAVNPNGVPAGFLQGDTIGNKADIESNVAVVSSDVLFIKLADRHYRLGGAPVPVPITETERIPSWQEIATVQTVGRRLEEYVPMIEPAIDWLHIESIRDRLVAAGREAFAGAMKGLAAAGIDTRDPAQMLIVLKRLGSTQFEELFGAGEPDEEFPRGRRPVVQTDLVKSTMLERARLLGELAERGGDGRIRGMKVLVTSTDVHEFAEFLLTSALDAVGAQVIDLGVNRDPEDIVKAVVETDADAVVVTTHNGVARSFGQLLMRELTVHHGRPVPVYMGGVLNEDIDGSEIPIDVCEDLNATGIQTPETIDRLIDALSTEASRNLTV